RQDICCTGRPRRPRGTSPTRTGVYPTISSATTSGGRSCPPGGSASMRVGRCGSGPAGWPGPPPGGESVPVSCAADPASGPAGPGPARDTGGMRALVIAAHLMLGAGWLGAMSYSLFMVQPKAARYFGADDDAHEEFVTALANGARWKVVGLLAAITATGVLLAVWAPHRTTGWWAGLVVKVGLLAVASPVC